MAAGSVQGCVREVARRAKRSWGCVSFAGFFAHFKETGSGASPIQNESPNIESRPKQITKANQYVAFDHT